MIFANETVEPEGAAAAGGTSSSSTPGSPPATIPADQAPKAAVEPDARKAFALTLPSTPTEEERVQHFLTHLPFRSWCSYCVKRKAKDEPHIH